MLLATEVPKRFSDTRVTTFRVLRPNQCTGNLFKEYDLYDKYYLVSDEVRWNLVSFYCM